MTMLRASSPSASTPACNYTEWSENDYCLIVQPYQVHDGGDLDGYVTYRVYIKTQNSDDFISSNR